MSLEFSDGNRLFPSRKPWRSFFHVSFRRENLIKNTIQTFLLGRLGICLVGFELYIELPEMLAHLLQIVSTLLAHGSDFVDASFSVYPEQRGCNRTLN